MKTVLLLLTFTLFTSQGFAQSRGSTTEEGGQIGAIIDLTIVDDIKQKADAWAPVARKIVEDPAFRLHLHYVAKAISKLHADTEAGKALKTAYENNLAKDIAETPFRI